MLYYEYLLNDYDYYLFDYYKNNTIYLQFLLHSTTLANVHIRQAFASQHIPYDAVEQHRLITSLNE